MSFKVLTLCLCEISKAFGFLPMMTLFDDNVEITKIHIYILAFTKELELKQNQIFR